MHISSYLGNSANSDGAESRVTRVFPETQTLLPPKLEHTSNKTHHSTLRVSWKKSVPVAGD